MQPPKDNSKLDNQDSSMVPPPENAPKIAWFISLAILCYEEEYDVIHVRYSSSCESQAPSGCSLRPHPLT